MVIGRSCEPDAASFRVMISHKHKCIFVHIPKCGGQSVEHIFLNDLGLGWKHRSPLLLRRNHDPAVGPPRLAHLTYRQYIEYHYASVEMWNEYFTFSVVRNPYTRIESLYRYMGYRGVISFEVFVCQRLKALLEGSRSCFVMPQVNYISAKDGDIAVDRVLKLEELNHTLPGVLRGVGIDVKQVPHVNKSSDAEKAGLWKRLKMFRQGVFQPSFRVDDEIVWTESALLVANTLFEQDFSVLGYEQTINT